MRHYVEQPPFQWDGTINRDSQQTNGLLLHFPLLNHLTNDIWKHQLTGTKAGAISFRPSPVTAGSWNYTGAATDYINIGDTPLVDFGSSDWGISVWLLTTTTSGAGHIFSKDGTGGTNPRQFSISRNGSSLAMYYWTAPGVYVYYDPGTSWLVTNTWYHVVMQRIGNTFQFAVNGSVVATNAGSGVHGAMNAGTTACRIGARVYSGFEGAWSGQLADLRVHNRALSAQEIWQLYDPQTRWELYTTPEYRQWFVPTVTGGIIPRIMHHRRQQAVS